MNANLKDIRRVGSRLKAQGSRLKAQGSTLNSQLSNDEGLALFAFRLFERSYTEQENRASHKDLPTKVFFR